MVHVDIKIIIMVTLEVQVVEVLRVSQSDLELGLLIKVMQEEILLLQLTEVKAAVVVLEQLVEMHQLQLAVLAVLALPQL